MKVKQVLQSEMVNENGTVIEIYRKMATMDRYERVADGYFFEHQVFKFEEVEVVELNYKRYPNIVTIFI
ncbi:MAG: hypothetical protein K1W10_00205 [Lachnospiraceae bacterium]